MKIISWNVAGLRARLKNDMDSYLINALFNKNESIDIVNYDIVCLQETKCNEEQINLLSHLKNVYPYRFWNSTKGTSQRKGLSGVCIWCTSPPINNLGFPEWDDEGRIITLEFNEFILINVYVPNSQKFDCERYHFRKNWNMKFATYINEIKTNFSNKEIIICGDMNVAQLDIDISNPKQKKNKVAGFFDFERYDFSQLLYYCELKDIYRNFYPNSQKSTYWSNFLKSERSEKNGWGIDYLLCSSNIINKIHSCNILMNIKGSDHCPMELIFK